MIVFAQKQACTDLWCTCTEYSDTSVNLFLSNYFFCSIDVQKLIIFQITVNLINAVRF